MGSRKDRDEWWYERDSHGYGKLNEVGRELLTFLSLNGTTVCNTWFQKRETYKHTWQHPKSKKWYCIDYAIIRHLYRRRCVDVLMVHEAECNTDHQSMLRMKLLVRMRRLFRRKHEGPGTRKFDVIPN